MSRKRRLPDPAPEGTETGAVPDVVPASRWGPALLTTDRCSQPPLFSFPFALELSVGCHWSPLTLEFYLTLELLGTGTGLSLCCPSPDPPQGPALPRRACSNHFCPPLCSLSQGPLVRRDLREQHPVHTSVSTSTMALADRSRRVGPWGRSADPWPAGRQGGCR